MEKLREEIQKTLDEERKNLKAFGDSVDSGEAGDMHNCQGWVEALEYVIKQMERLSDD